MQQVSGRVQAEAPEPQARERSQPLLRLGVIGLGAVAQAVHLPLLGKHPDLFRTTAICDLSPSATAAIGDALGVPTRRRFTSAEDLLAAEDLDAVAIMSSGSHGGLAAAAARAGLAVFCEKPLALTLAEADALADAGGRVMLAYMKLYDPAVERARLELNERPRPRSVEVTVLHPPAPPQLAHVRLHAPPVDIAPAMLDAAVASERALVERALGPAAAALGGIYTEILLGSVVHDLAVIRYLVGGPLEIDDADLWPEPEPHSLALQGRLPEGTRVSIRWHYLQRYPAYREEVHVHHDAGSVALAFPSPYLLHAPTELTIVDAEGEAERTVRVRSTVEAFERQWLAFARYAAAGEAPRAGVAEGRADIAVCQQAAAALAARRGVAIGGEAA